LETELQNRFELEEAWVIPSGGTGTSMSSVGKAGASFLLDHLQDGDVIAIGGGTTLHALVESVVTERKYKVDVVPMVGGIQGHSTTGVNYLASQLAERLGGRAFQLYSPAFVETAEQREALLQMAPIKEILDIARRASIALLGVGTVEPDSSLFVMFTALSPEEMHQITDLHCGVGETLAIVYDTDGKLCAPEYAERVVGLTFEELGQIPLRIGVAGTAAKSRAIYGALRGEHLSCIVTDEAAAKGVIEYCHTQQEARFQSEYQEDGANQIQELSLTTEA
jgi:DNA-binding transcriptional regulator LsrR (DeoR family)